MIKAKLIRNAVLLLTLLLSTSCIELAKIVPNYYAKEMCSCVFVMEQSEEYCREDIAMDPAPQKLKVDLKKKVVKSSFYIFKEKAYWISDEEGCQIK